MSDLEADLDLALGATRRAGELVLRWFRQDPDVRMKSPDQPVTEADLAADRLLRETLLAARPAYGWLSEETADHPDRLGRSRVWVVDPIDGTRSFVAGRPEFAISVGLVENGAPVLGIVLNPALDELYWGMRGAGAWRSTGAHAAEPLAVASDDAPPVFVASRSEIRRGEVAPIVEHLPGQWHVDGLGSTAFKMARIAAGSGTAFASRGPKSEWDVCAAALLVEMAGGVASDGRGRRFRFNRRDPARRGAIACRPGVHAAVVAALDTTSGIGRNAPRGPRGTGS